MGALSGIVAQSEAPLQEQRRGSPGALRGSRGRALGRAPGYGLDHSGNSSTDANGIKTDELCGGPVQRVTYANTCMTQVKHLIVVNAYYGSCSGTPGTRQFKDIIVNGVNATNSRSGAYSRIDGYDANDLAQLFLADVSLDATAQSGDQNASVSLDDSKMASTSGSVPVCAF